MDRPAFEIVEEKITLNNNVLIFDKNGFIGAYLAQRLKEQLSIIFVSQAGTKKYPQDLLGNITNLIPVNYRKDIPEIPNGEFSHIFVILDPENKTLEFIPSFVKQAEKSKARLIVIMPLGMDNDQVTKNFIQSYKNSAVVFYGDLFGPDCPIDFSDKVEAQSTISNFFYQAKKSERIVILGDGTGSSYPVFFEDVIDGVLEVAFGMDDNSVFLIFPRHEITDLSLAHHFHKINPSIKIDFNHDKNDHSKFAKRKKITIPKGNYFLPENYLLEHKIKHTLEILNSKEVKQEKNEENPPAGGEKEAASFSFLPLGLFLTFLISLPLITTLLFTFFAFYQLKAAKNEIEKGNLAKAVKSVGYSDQLFKMAGGNSKVFDFEMSLIGQKKVSNYFIGQIESGQEATFLLSDALTASKKFMDVFSNESKKPREDFLIAVNSLKKSISMYQKIRAEKNNKLLLSYLGRKDFQGTVNYLSSTADAFPDLFGFTKEKKYLVLFQNNMELRPGGGFIGSFGILTIRLGKVKEFQIHDVYEADGQLKGHVEPSFPIRRYMPLVHLYLRDSNFNVDYSRGASVSALLLNEEMKVMVDGVIAVDVTFVRNLLKDIGPVYVPDYKETVTADNLYILTQAHAEKNFFPGSSQKKDFLKSLFNAIQINLSTKKDVSIAGFFKNIGESISQKHLLFAFSDLNTQNLFSINGMSSSLLDMREESENKINDFMGINDANIGVNKANYYIKRKIVQNVSIENDGSVSERLTVIYKNDSRTNVWPGGDYKNYVRFILPKGTDLKSVVIDGKEQRITEAITDPAIYEKKNFKPPPGLEVEVYEQDGKTIYGFLFIAPSEKFTTVSIFYNLKKKISLEKELNIYDIKLFKQPGTDDDSYDLILDYLPSLNFLKLEDDSSIDGQLKTSTDRIEYKTKLLKDMNLRVNLTKD